MTISKRSHAILCDLSIGGATLVHLQDGTTEQAFPRRREAVRNAVAARLVEDWRRTSSTEACCGPSA